MRCDVRSDGDALMPGGGVPRWRSQGDRATRPMLGHTDPDEVLVLALKRGDPAAVEMLVDMHADRVYRLALRITGSRSSAEQVVRGTLRTVSRTTVSRDGER